MLHGLKGKFGKHTYYSVVIEAKDLKKVFKRYLEILETADKIAPMQRAQRILDSKRIKSIVNYLSRQDRFFGGVISSFKGKAKDKFGNIVELEFEADPYLIDGQHRIVSMIKKHEADPTYNDTINVLFISAISKDEQQQIFSDINNKSQKSNASLTILYNHTSPVGKLALEYAPDCLLEQERSTVATNSKKMVTPSIMQDVFVELLGVSKKQLTETSFVAVNDMLEPWKAHLEALFEVYATVLASQEKPTEYRKISVMPHTVTLMALIKLMKWAKESGISPEEFKKRVTAFEASSISGRVHPLWEGRCILGGRMRKNDNAILLTAIGVAEETKIKPTDTNALMMMNNLSNDLDEVEAFA